MHIHKQETLRLQITHQKFSLFRFFCIYWDQKWNTNTQQDVEQKKQRLQYPNIQLQSYWLHKTLYIVSVVHTYIYIYILCVCVWTHCCLTDSWGNYTSTVAVTPMQPHRLSPHTPVLMNPSAEANAKTYVSAAKNILTKCPGEGRWTEQGGRRKREKIKVHKMSETELTNRGESVIKTERRWRLPGRK